MTILSFARECGWSRALPWKIEAGKVDLDVLIPPNTIALVTLPGSDIPPIEVGSGSWHWSVLYQDPDARGPCTADDVVGEIMSDNAACDAIMEPLPKWKGWVFCS